MVRNRSKTIWTLHSYRGQHCHGCLLFANSANWLTNVDQCKIQSRVWWHHVYQTFKFDFITEAEMPRIQYMWIIYDNSPQTECWSLGRHQGWMCHHLGLTYQLYLGYQTCQADPYPAAGRGGVELSWRGCPEGGMVQRGDHGGDGGAACGLAGWGEWWAGCWSPHHPNHPLSMTEEKEIKTGWMRINTNTRHL